MMMRHALAGLVLLVLTRPLAAQAPQPARPTDREELTLELSIFRGALGYARRISPERLLGIDAGFGFPQVDRTLHPDDEQADFEEYLHIAGFLRLQPSPAVDIDAGLRASVADLWQCTASDCWPALFGGAYLQPMIGWRRLKVGMRLVAGVIGEGRESTTSSSTFLVALDPLIVRATFSW